MAAAPRRPHHTPASPLTHSRVRDICVSDFGNAEPDDQHLYFMYATIIARSSTSAAHWEAADAYGKNFLVKFAFDADAQLARLLAGHPLPLKVHLHGHVLNPNATEFLVKDKLGVMALPVSFDLELQARAMDALRRHKLATLDDSD